VHRDPARGTQKADEERRESEEAGEEGEQNEAWIEGDRPAKGQDAEEARQPLNPGGSEAPPNSVPSAELGGEDRGEQAYQEQRAPWTESDGQLGRIRQHESERDQDEDGQERPERCSPDRDGDRPRSLPGREAPMRLQR